MLLQHRARRSRAAWFSTPLDQVRTLFDTSSPEAWREPALDGIRGLAVLLVFAVHADQTFLALRGASSLSLWFLNGGGHAGVDLFFLLSGYLIYGILLERPQPYGRFLARRLKRIYPAFTAVFVLYILLSLMFPGKSKLPADAPGLYLAQNFFLLPGIFDLHPMITVAWSLSYEMCFYLTVPWVAGGMRSWPVRHRCAALAAFAVLYSIYSVADRHRALAIGPFILPPAAHMRFVLFAAGMLVHELSRQPYIRLQLVRREPLVIAAAVSLFPMLYLIEERFAPFMSLPGFPRFPEVYRTWLLALLLPPAFLCALSPGSRIRHFLSAAWFAWAGRISYSFYLIHGVALLATGELYRALAGSGVNSGIFLYWSAVTLAGCASLASASTLFLLVEKPCSLSRLSPNRSNRET